MKTFILTFVFLFILKTTFSQNNFTDDYPLNIGNVFVYGWNSYGGGYSSNGIKKIYISSDTVVSGLRYFRFRDGNNSTFYRLDTMTGKMFVLSSICSGASQYMLDSLWGGLNETALRCTGRVITCTSVLQRLLFGNYHPSKIFTETAQVGAGYSTTIRQYAKGFGLIYYSSVYSGPPVGTGSSETLRGCVLDGIVYGDTSMILNGLSILGVNVPISFGISQNYPNPFNPVTKVKIDIPKATNITFVIFDIIGKILYEENEYLSAGSYEFKWDASSYSSGVYFYRLTADNYFETRKMLMIK